MSGRAKRALLISLVLGASLACGPKPRLQARGRGVLVIAIDALRADHLSCYGYDRATTPVFDGLAQQGAAFLETWSTAPELLPAHASILTGCDPLLARRRASSDSGPAIESTSWFIPDGVPRLAQQFLAHGFATAAFVDHPALSQIHGFDKGFQDFFGFREETVSPQMQYGFEGVASKLVNWLRARDPTQDWFAYVHVNDLERVWTRPGDDPSDSYFEPRPELSQVPPVAEADHVFFAVPRSRWTGGTLSLAEYETRYDGALHLLDKNLGGLFTRLRGGEKLKNTTIVIVGTYGISFGESGLYADSGTLSDVDLRVPMIVRPPAHGTEPRAIRSTNLASIEDLAPTLLDLLGVPVPKGMQGVSQKGVFEGKVEPARTIAFASGGLQRGIAAIDARWCWERTLPGRGASDVIAMSWYGDDVTHVGAPRTFLHDRGSGAPGSPRPSPAAKGHLEDGAHSPDDEARLGQAAHDWFDWIDQARLALHSPPGMLDKVRPDVLLELKQRGFLGGVR
jgi:arylsulfatase A-like enzyme